MKALCRSLHMHPWIVLVGGCAAGIAAFIGSAIASATATAAAILVPAFTAAPVVAVPIAAGQYYGPIPSVLLPFASSAGAAVPRPPQPSTAAPSGELWITDTLHDTVNVADIAGRRIVKVIRVGADPQAIAFHPERTEAYVANRADASITVIDTVTRTVVATLEDPDLDGPYAIVFDKSGSRAFVTGSRSGKVVVIDTLTRTIARRFTVGDGPTNLVLRDDGLAMAVSNSDPFTPPQPQEHPTLEGTSVSIILLDSTAPGSSGTVLTETFADPVVTVASARVVVVEQFTETVEATAKASTQAEADVLAMIEAQITADILAAQAAAQAQPQLEAEARALERLLILTEKAIYRYEWPATGASPVDPEASASLAVAVDPAKAMLVDAAGRRAYVLVWEYDDDFSLHRSRGKLLVVDVEPHEGSLQTMALLNAPLTLAEGPMAMGLQVDGSKLFVGSSANPFETDDPEFGGVVERVDTTTLLKDATIEIPKRPPVGAIALTPQDLLVVGRSTVHVYPVGGPFGDPVASFSIRGSGPMRMVLAQTPDRRRLFASYPGLLRVGSYVLAGTGSTAVVDDALLGATGDGPYALAFRNDPGGRRVYATLSESFDRNQFQGATTVAVLDADSGLSLPPFPDSGGALRSILAVGSAPNGSSVHAGSVGGYDFTNATQQNCGMGQVLASDVEPSVDLSSPMPPAVAVLHDASNVYALLCAASDDDDFDGVMDALEGALGAVALAGGASQERPLARFPVALALTANGQHLFVAHFGGTVFREDIQGSDEVHVFSTAAILGSGVAADFTVPLGAGGPHGLAGAVAHPAPAAGDRVVFCPAFTSNSVFGFSAATTVAPTLVRLVGVGEGPVDLEVFGSGATTRVYCCNYFDGTVTVLDPAQPASPVVAVIPVGEGPIDLVRDGTLLYVANSVSGGIAVIDTTTNTKLPAELLLP